jgi:DNA invertase Pin-like site-specific DNA recombinase
MRPAVTSISALSELFARGRAAGGDEVRREGFSMQTTLMTFLPHTFALEPVIRLVVTFEVALGLAVLFAEAPEWRRNASGTGRPRPGLAATVALARARTPMPSRRSHGSNGNGHVGMLQRPAENAGPVVPASSSDTAERELLGPGVAVLGYVCVREGERLANGDDYEAQAQAIEAFCRDRGLRLVRIVRDVERPAGRAAGPGLQHACQVLADDGARALVVQDLGRLTHSPARLALLLRWLADAHRELIAIGSGLDTSTAAGRQTATTLIEVGEWMQQRTSERRDQNGTHGRGGGRPAVRDRPDLLARIKALREKGLSLRAIADTLNAEGVPTLRGGARWRPSSIQVAVGDPGSTARDTRQGLKLPPPPAPADNGMKR